MKTKICTKCHEEKPLDEFYKSKHSKGGHRHVCGICVNKYKREKRANDPEYRERENKSSREKYANDPKYRERRNKSSRERRREKYANDPEYRELISKRERERLANDPKYREQKNKSNRERYRNAPEYRELIRKSNREKYANDPEFRKNRRLENKQRVEKLKPAYVREIIKAKYKIPKANITNDMVERERDLLKINRLFRRQSNGGTKKIN